MRAPPSVIDAQGDPDRVHVLVAPPGQAHQHRAAGARGLRPSRASSASACELSSAGMMPSAREQAWKASSASASVALT